MSETPNSSVAVKEDKTGSFLQDKTRYVGPKETIAYVAFDMGCSFTIQPEYGDRFITNILQVSLSLQNFGNSINLIWDVINDFFTANIVDKTRTRIGKFKPYLLFLSIPGTILTLLYWSQPLFLSETELINPSSMHKFLFWLILKLVTEGVSTFKGFAQTGFLATLTPNPVDRTRLITVANFFSGMLGEKLPEYLMTGFLDAIDNGLIKLKHQTLFVTMGIFTTVVAGIATFWFFFASKERVMQSVERPSIKQGFKAIINNKPILLLTLSGFLGGLFSIGGKKSDYLIDVLHFNSLATIAGIPGGIITPLSYAFYPWYKKHFSMKFLFIYGKYGGNFLYVLLFLFGLLGPKKNRFFKRRIPMAIALTLWEIIFSFSYSLKKIVPAEITNEAMDYCEWKNGYRSEAMISAAQGVVTKCSGEISKMIGNWFNILIGYDQTAYVRGTAQTEKAQLGVFAKFTVFPAIAAIFGAIPILFYDLSGEKRDRMYDELLARRAEFNIKATDGSQEALADVAKAQKAISQENKKL